MSTKMTTANHVNEDVIAVAITVYSVAVTDMVRGRHIVAVIG